MWFYWMEPDSADLGWAHSYICKQLGCWLGTDASGRPPSHCSYWLRLNNGVVRVMCLLASSRIACAFSHSADRDPRKRTNSVRPLEARPQNWHSITFNVFWPNQVTKLAQIINTHLLLRGTVRSHCKGCEFKKK